MPLILDPPSYGRWLDGSPREGRDIFAGLQVLPEELLESYTVSTLVNRAGIEDPRCLEPAKPSALW
jgi:putative SOS response-associated peptidase YedK